MITIITVMGIIEAATVTPIMMTTIVTKITFTNTRRPHRKPEGEAGNLNRWVANMKFTVFPMIFLLFYFLFVLLMINAVI